MDLLDRVYQRIINRDIDVSLQSYEIIVGMYSASGKLPKAVTAFEEMDAKQMTPSPRLLTSTFKFCVKHRDSASAKKIYDLNADRIGQKVLDKGKHYNDFMSVLFLLLSQTQIMPVASTLHNLFVALN